MNAKFPTEKMPDDVFDDIFGQVLATSERGQAIAAPLNRTAAGDESAQIATTLLNLHANQKMSDRVDAGVYVPGQFPADTLQKHFPMTARSADESHAENTSAGASGTAHTLHAIGIPLSVAAYFASEKYFALQDLVKDGFEESDVEPCMHYLMQEKIVPFVDGIIARRKLKVALQGMATAKRR